MSEIPTTDAVSTGKQSEIITTSLRGDGRQQVFRVRENGVLYLEKFHGRKRGHFRSIVRASTGYFLFGRSWAGPRSCRKVEAGVLKLWRREGFDVPGPPPASVSADSGNGALRMEWIPGTSLGRALTNGESTPERNEAVLTKFGEITRRRHDRAVELREPRLLVEHASLDHVLASNGRLAHIDFEIVARRRHNIEALIRRELAAFLVSLYRTSHELYETWIEVVVRAYDHRPRIETLCREMLTYGMVPTTRLVAPFLRLAGRGRHRRRMKLVGGILERVLERI